MTQVHHDPGVRNGIWLVSKDFTPANLMFAYIL